MVTSDMKSHLKIVLFYLKMTSLWPNADRYRPYTFSKILIIFYIIVVGFLFVLPQVISLTLSSNNLEIFISTMYVIMSELNATLKMCFFMANLPLIKSIMGRFDQEMYQPKNEHQKMVMMKLFRPWAIMWITLLTFGHMSVFLYAITGFIARELPLMVWLPFDQHRVYWVLFVHQTFSLYYLAMVNINTDGLFPALMVYIASECEFVCDNLRNIHDFTRERLEKDSDNRIFKDDVVINEYNNSLKVIVKHHRAILKLADDVNVIFTYIVAFQLFTSILTICMTMFQLSVLEPLSGDFCNLVLYQGCMFLEILLYCWCGNEAMLSSCKIPLAAYESNWVPATLEFKKNLFFFIVRTQTPIKLYAIRFFELSLVMFSNILQTSWSYFTLLRQVCNRNE